MKSETSEKVVFYPDRPGCITAYAVLLWLGGGLLVLSTLSLFSESSTGSAIFSGLFAIFLIAIGIGLWQMQSWGWWLVVIVQSLSVLAALLSLIGGAVLYGLASGSISGGILYWFFTNRQLFIGTSSQVASIDPNGEPIPAQASASKTVVIVGIILAVFLVPVCIIAALSLLALLGPQIGDVFSRITSGLAATPMP